MNRLLLILLLSTVCISLQAQFSISFDNSFYKQFVFIDTVDCHHNIWQVGRPHKVVFDSAYSYPNAIVTDTLNPYPVNDTSVFILKVPGISPQYGTFPIMSFAFYYQLDIDSGVKTEIDMSLDSGAHWINLYDSLPYGYTWNLDTPDIKHSTSSWTRFYLFHNWVFTPTTPDTLLFRFTLISDSVFANKDGWIIDSVNCFYWWEGAAKQVQNNNHLTIFPNPTTTSLTIQSTNQPITSITITNLLGQTVYNQKCNSDNVQVNVSALPTGVYFVKVNGVEVRKFLKE